MKIRMICFIIGTMSFVFSQTYCTGDVISEAHQNITHEVCAGMDDYDTGSEFKLADFNGDLNGGNYHITFIDMSASW